MGIETIELDEICYGAPVDTMLLLNLINLTRVSSWKRIYPRVNFRTIRIDFKAPVFLSGDFVVLDVHQDRLDLIDGLLKDTCLYCSDKGSAANLCHRLTESLFIYRYPDTRFANLRFSWDGAKAEFA